MIASVLSCPTRLFHLPAAARLVSTLAVTVACGTRLEPSVVQVSDRGVEVVEQGQGDTTVVFESGLGDDWTSWDQVASQVAKSTRVFAYSRPGYGQSESSEQPRDAAHIVEDLRSLLADQHVPPPYVLAGHSFGGAYMELFAKAHPEEVAGVVLVEPRHRDFTQACHDAGLDGCTPSAKVVAALPQVQRDEFEAFALVSEEIQRFGAFGQYPVRVLTGTVHWGFGPQLESLWQSMGASLAKEAADGKQQVFVGAGHYLQNERPEDVIEVILSLLPARH